MTALLLPTPLPLSEAFPQLVGPIKEDLRACEKLIEEDLRLADTVNDLHVHALCGCRDDFCASFYTVEPPAGAWRDDHTCLVGGSTVFAFDVVHGAVAFVEIINADAEEMRAVKARYDELAGHSR